MSKTTPPTKTELTTRPYTSYNLFFQLEREYILQTLLEYKPPINATTHHEDVFHPTNIKSNYQGGPALPDRYANLTLPFDWHIPGKTRRRKRLHRKSHGMIGFHELNERISQAWKAADGSIKDFCASLSEIEARKYKKTNTTAGAINIKRRRGGLMAKKKQRDTTKNKKTMNKIKPVKKMPIENEPSREDDLFAFDCWSSRSPQDLLIEDISFNDRSTSPKISRVISHEYHPTITEVDMKDDEIMDIWKSIPLFECDGNDKEYDILDVTPDPSPSPAFQVCVEIPSNTDVSQPEVVVTPQKQEDATTEIIEQQLLCDDKTKKSFIDEEYEKFREIGKQFLLLRRLPAASGLKRRGFAARQA